MSQKLASVNPALVTASIDIIDPPRARCRISEAQLLQDAAFVGEARRQNLVLLGFRDMRDGLRKEGAL